MCCFKKFQSSIFTERDLLFHKRNLKCSTMGARPEKNSLITEFYSLLIMFQDKFNYFVRFIIFIFACNKLWKIISITNRKKFFGVSLFGLLYKIIGCFEYRLF